MSLHYRLAKWILCFLLVACAGRVEAVGYGAEPRGIENGATTFRLPADGVTKAKPKRPRTEPWAIVSLVTGILGLLPVAIVTGLVAHRRIDRYNRRGENMANIGMFISLFTFVPFLLLLAVILL